MVTDHPIRWCRACCSATGGGKPQKSSKIFDQNFREFWSGFFEKSGLPFGQERFVSASLCLVSEWGMQRQWFGIILAA